MNRKYLFAWLLVFVVWFFGSFLIHGLLLHGDYMQVGGLFRTDADSQQYFPWMILAHVMLAGAFVWIYARGVASRPWLAQGLRFGLAVAFLAVVPNYLIYYVVQPMPGGLVMKQILLDGALVVILGALVAWLYRDRAVRA